MIARGARGATRLALTTAAGLALGLCASLAHAEAPATTLRPLARAEAAQPAQLTQPTALSLTITPPARPFGVLVRGTQASGPVLAPVWQAALRADLPLVLLLMLDDSTRAPPPLAPRYPGLDGNGIAPGPLAALSSVRPPGARLAAHEARQRQGNAVSVDVARLSRLFAGTLSNRVQITRPPVVEPDETLLSAALVWDGVRPLARPQAGSVAEQTLRTTNKAPLRPIPRPDRPGTSAQSQIIPLAGPQAARPAGPQAAFAPPSLSEQAVAVALIPPTRPAGITQAYEAARVARARGSVCGNPEIQGRVVDAIGGNSGCGLTDPVQVTSVSGVALSTPATVDCATAEALNDWVRRGAAPAVGGTGGGISSLQIMGSYACRSRNNQAGARLSEHARGRAVDIGGLILRDGSEVSVLRHWGGTSYGAMLRQMHAEACGPFGTVLGPNANAAHRNHFHFDTARYRSGSYCR